MINMAMMHLNKEAWVGALEDLKILQTILIFLTLILSLRIFLGRGLDHHLGKEECNEEVIYATTCLFLSMRRLLGKKHKSEFLVLLIVILVMAQAEREALDPLVVQHAMAMAKLDLHQAFLLLKDHAQGVAGKEKQLLIHA